MGGVYVLVHGAARGAWLWDKVVPILRERRLRAYALDLPGHGLRQAERRGVTMQSYIDDVAEFVINKNLTDVTLVGHSMSGVVISGVAERLPDRIKHLVYVAGMVLKDGEALADFVPHERASLMEKLAKESDDNSVTYGPDMTANYFFDAPKDVRDWALPLVCPQPYAPFTDRLNFPKFYQLRIPRTYVLCTYDQLIARSRAEEFSKRLGVGYVDLDTSHDPMLSQPNRVAEILDIVD